jgi:hypothetical protein
MKTHAIQERFELLKPFLDEKRRRLLAAAEAKALPYTRGQPDSPLRWTCKSVRRLADELKKMGHATSHRMVAALLQDLGYSLPDHAVPSGGTAGHFGGHEEEGTGGRFQKQWPRASSEGGPGKGSRARLSD